MKARCYLLALSIGLGVACAQTTQPSPSPQDTPQSTSPAKPQTSTPSVDKTSTATSPASPAPAEMKIATYKGVLVDVACSSGKSASAAATPAQSSDASKTSTSGQADRAASDGGANCPVSASSSQLGMKLDDGRTVRFDLVGNQRAQEALKNDKKWNKNMSANAPIKAKVSGVLNGDKLIVTSIQ